MFVVPDVTFNECAEKQEKANFSAIVRLETKAGMGCDRESFEASDSFTVCGASDFIDLLPKPGTGREWTEALNTETKRNGEGGMLRVHFLVESTVSAPHRFNHNKDLQTNSSTCACDLSFGMVTS